MRAGAVHVWMGRAERGLLAGHAAGTSGRGFSPAAQKDKKAFTTENTESTEKGRERRRQKWQMARWHMKRQEKTMEEPRESVCREVTWSQYHSASVPIDFRRNSTMRWEKMRRLESLAKPWPSSGK